MTFFLFFLYYIGGECFLFSVNKFGFGSSGGENYEGNFNWDGKYLVGFICFKIFYFKRVNFKDELRLI